MATLTFAEVLEKNQAIIKKMKELNYRAGEEIFPIPTEKELAQFFLEKLNGARSMSEVKDFSDVLLVLDEQAVKKVMLNNPDTITVLGREVKMDYRYNPYALIDFFEEESRGWLNLPEGIYLPSGREVSIKSRIERKTNKYEKIDEVSSSFKRAVTKLFNERTWEEWPKPYLPLPVEAILPILEEEYGKCAATGEALIAYGVIKLGDYSAWSQCWTRSPEEAEKEFKRACAEFTERQCKRDLKLFESRVSALDDYSANLGEELRAIARQVLRANELKVLVEEFRVLLEAAEKQKAEAEAEMRQEEVVCENEAEAECEEAEAESEKDEIEAETSQEEIKKPQVVKAKAEVLNTTAKVCEENLAVADEIRKPTAENPPSPLASLGEKWGATISSGGGKKKKEKSGKNTAFSSSSSSSSSSSPVPSEEKIDERSFLEKSLESLRQKWSG